MFSSLLGVFLIFTLFKVNDHAASRGLNGEVASRGVERKNEEFGFTLDENPRETKRPPRGYHRPSDGGGSPIIQHYDHLVRQPWRQVRIVHACRGDGGERMANAIKRRLSRHVGVRTISNVYFLNLDEAVFKILGKRRGRGLDCALHPLRRLDFLNDYMLIDVIEAAVNHQTTVAQEWEARNLDAAYSMRDMVLRCDLVWF